MKKKAHKKKTREELEKIIEILEELRQTGQLLIAYPIPNDGRPACALEDALGVCINGDAIQIDNLVID